MSKLILNNENVILNITETCEYAHVVGEGKKTHWEQCSEEIAREDYKNRQVLDYKIIDGGIIIPKGNMIIPFATGADRIVEVEVPDYVKAQEYKYENGQFIINTPIRIQKIKDELTELDTIINRATEDLYVAMDTTAYVSVQEVIDRKNALRAELAALEA